jgi:D-amino-acid oxidase
MTAKLTGRQFRVLSISELPPGIDAGTEFTSVCINITLYLPYLVGQNRKHGVVLSRGILSHISDACTVHHSGKPADIIINCTGLLASKLGGVEDKTVVPARGQTVIVRNDSRLLAGSSGTDDGEDELVYFMNRASGGGTVLGGSYQIGNWDSQPDLNLATRIMQRAVKLHPQLADGKGIEGLSIIRHTVGLRPYRKEGVRLEKEKIDGVWIVHNYGHAGWVFLFLVLVQYANFYVGMGIR